MSCEYEDLRAGDVFRAYRCDVPIDPLLGTPVEHDHLVAALCEGAARPVMPHGYGVPCHTGDLDELLSELRRA